MGWRWKSIPSCPDAVIVEPKCSRNAEFQYFLKGELYWKWDAVHQVAVRGYPKKWKWHGIPPGPDVVIVMPEESPDYCFEYFVKGDKVWKWDVKRERLAPGYPQPWSMQRSFSGVPARDINAVVTEPKVSRHSGTQYFIKGDHYWKRSLREGVDHGSPRPWRWHGIDG